MEIALKVRRRPSNGNLSLHRTRSEEAGELLGNGEEDFQHLLGEGEEVSKRSMRNSERHRDYSGLLRPFSILISTLVLFTIALASYDALLRSSHNRLDIFKVFHVGGIGDGSSRKIGIDLHPKNHVFRGPKTITHHWTVTSGFLSPDGVKKGVYFVNGEFPGPTIQCRSGDKLVIHVNNELADEGVSIHWHGLQMRNANAMDGAVGFTQCPIPSGKRFTYEFDIDEDQSGTFWWHAHSQAQRGDGLYGGLVVHKPEKRLSDMESYGYKKEMLFLIGDWYHRDGEQVLSWYTSVRGFGNEPVPDSLLVNGVGRFVCSMALPARPVECVDIVDEQNLGIPATGATRLRVVNVGTLAGFTLGFDSGSLKPITVDGGHYIEGRSVESVGILYPGERMDLILEWNAGSNFPRFRISLDRENFKYPNHALRPDQSFQVFPSTNHHYNNPAGEDGSLDIPISQNADTHFDLASATSTDVAIQGPSTAQRTLLLYTKTQKLSINSNHPQGFMNRTSWTPQTPPLISLSRTSFDANQLIPFLPFHPSEPIWVDIILNNLDDGAHPFHLHGHDFYILASHRSDHGWGSYSPWAKQGSASIVPKLNLENPIMKDTVSVPRRGFVVLRFRADNPGIWMFHCHILFHQGSGMAMGFHIGSDEDHKDFVVSADEFCSQINRI